MRLEAYKKIFPDLECIGWYTAQKNQADTPTLADAHLHKRFQQFSENPLLAILNPDNLEAQKQKLLPLFLYELDSTSTTNDFLKQDFALATSDSERIAVDHVVKQSETSATTSQLSTNMTASLNALKMLRRKIRQLVEAVRTKPEIRANHNLMRGLQQICAQLPIAEAGSFDQHAFSDYADVQAVNLLGTVLKASEMFNGLVEDFKLSTNQVMQMSQLMEGGVMDEDDLPQHFMHGGKPSSKKPRGGLI